MATKKALIILIALLLTIPYVFALGIKDIFVNPKNVEIGDPIEISVVIDTQLKIIGVEGFLTFPDGSSTSFYLESSDGITYTYLFDKTDQEGGYGLEVVVSDEKESAKAFTKFEVARESIPLPSLNTTIEVVKNDTNKIITILNATQKQMTDISSNLSQIVKSTNKPTIKVFGTEYQINDNATIFLQLVDTYSQPINTSLCYLKIFYPNKTAMLNDELMTYKMNSAGLYYYDLIIPNITGVYMVSAHCYIYHNMTYLTDIADSYISAGAPNTTYGNLTDLVTGDAVGQPFNSLILFNVSQISLSGLDNVSLATYHYITMGVPVISLYKITSNWNESSVTWTNRPTFNQTILDTKTISGSGWQLWSITNLVRGWLNGTANYGVFFNKTASSATFNYSAFYSREFNNDSAPKLIVFYHTDEQVIELRGSGELHVSTYEVVQISLLNQILSYLQNTIYPYLQQLWNKLLGLESQLNTTIIITNQTLNLSNLIKNDTSAIVSYEQNQTISENLTRNLIINATTNLSEMIDDLEANTSEDFNYTWALIHALNISIQGQNNSEILAYLQAIQNSINATQTIIININGSLSEQVAEINSSIAEINNNLGNITEIVTEINNSVNQINTTVVIINNTVNNIWDYLVNLNVTEGELHLEVTAPALCLLDTNWVALARVSDSYDQTLDPGDGVACNMTTDLWGTSDMAFDYAKSKYKYIHNCDPDYTTFNWSVSCGR